MSFFKLPFHWIRLASSHRLFWLGGPVLLYVWTLGQPLFSDDLHLILKAERYHRGETDSLRLMRFATSDESWRALRSRGTIPWWVPESGRLDFFRPITELSFYLDVVLFGRNPVGYRLMSLLVFTLALMAVHWMFRQAIDDPVRSGAATFFWGISQTVALPVVWASNRQDLLVVIGVALAVGAYWSAVRRSGWSNLVLAVGGFTLALLSKELAVALAAVVPLYEIGRRIRARRFASQPVPAVIALALMVVAAAYLTYYASSRPWAFESAGTDGAPNQIGPWLPVSLLLYLSVWMVGFPVDVLHGASNELIFLIATAGGLLLVLAAKFLRLSMRGDPAAIFFLLWALLFIVPGLRTLTPSSRTLCVATIGWTYLLVGLIVPTREEDVVVPLVYRQFIYTANGIVAIACGIAAVLVMVNAELAAQARLNDVVARLPDGLRPNDTIVFDQARSPFEMIGAGDRLTYLAGVPQVGVIFLCPPKERGRLLVEDRHTLRLETAGGDGALFKAPMHRLSLGRDWQPDPQRAFRLDAFTATFADLADDRVKAVRFRFHAPLDAPVLHFEPPALIDPAGPHEVSGP